MAPASHAIGIDLGTANTCVAFYRNGHVEIIPDNGRRTMPSYVAFTETGRLIGAAAKNQVGVNPENTVFDALRLIGRKFIDPEIQVDMKHFPFKTFDKAGKPVISVDYRGNTNLLTPEAVLSMILARAKENAEAYLGSTVDKAVVTVPSYFTTSQRQLIRDAALVSELQVLYLINGSTAAATTYAFDSRFAGERNLLVVDLGAGTLDVTLGTIEELIIEVKSTAGDTHLGGEDFDNRLVNRFVNEFKRKWKKDITENGRALRRLRTACERAKRELSSQKQTHIRIDSLYEGIDFNSTVTRSSFEEYCQDLFRFILEPIERVLRDARMDKSSVHEIVVVGGSSRIPKIQKLLSDFFNGKEVSKSLNPDEAAACGAAILAAIYSGDSYEESSRLKEVLLLNVVPTTLGIETAGGVMTPLIKRNTFVPTKKSQVFSTAEDNQASFCVSVFEGERAYTRDNKLLGKLSLPLPPAPRGVPQIEIAFDCNIHGIKDVTALEKGTGKKVTVSLGNTGGLSAEEIERMQAEAEKYKEDDAAEAERVSARNALESYAYTLRRTLRCSSIESSTMPRVTGLVDMILAWIYENQSVTAFEYRLRQTELEKISASMSTEFSDAERTKVDSPDILPVRGRGENRAPDLSGDWASPEGASGAEAAGSSDSPLRPSSHEPSLTARPGSSPPPNSFRPSSASSDPLRTKASNAPAPGTPCSSEKGLGNLFSTSSGEARAVYTDIEFNQISTYLRNTGRSSWSTVPRLYTVLRLIRQLPLLDSFIDQGVTDIWFPFTTTSLPDALTPSVRASFLASQSVVLSKALRFEKSSDRRHAHFAEGEPLPFEVVGRLGSGAHGYVDKVMSTLSHREYARKLFRRTRGVGKEDIKSFLTELQVLKRISHIHCVELVQSYTDPKYFALIMFPVADCNLFEYYSLASDSTNKLSLLRSFFGCLANALQYVHNIKIRHRDIKPQNILVKADRVFLTDFGIALDWEHLSRSTTTEDSGKTWPYAAPEIARFEKRNTSSDIWSVGCVFLEMVTVLKREKVAHMRDFFKERNDDYRFYTNIGIVPEWMDKLRTLGSAKDNAPLKWVTQMLQDTLTLRPTAAKLFSDITAESASEHIPFCGPCCRDGNDSSGVDDDDQELWGNKGEPTI